MSPVKRLGVLSVVYVAAFASAMAVPHIVHQSREKVDILQGKRNERLQLQEEWGRLLLEENTWGAYARIENLALSDYAMQRPDLEVRR